MSMSGIFARIVAMIGAAMILMRRWGANSEPPAIGSTPSIPAAKPQGIPTLKMPTAKGWSQGHTPIAAPGLKVNAFAAGLKHPRWIHVLPNGDVLTAEALSEPGGIRTAFDYAIFSAMKRAAAVGVSPNRITLLRDADGDGVAEIRETFIDGLNQPFGIPWSVLASGRHAARFSGRHGDWSARLLEPQHAERLPGGLHSLRERPAGPPRDILTGFLAPDEKFSYGRPVGVSIGPDGSLLVADDAGDVIWRVTG